VKFSETPAVVQSPPPLLGQHTAEVLANLGYDVEAQQKLKEANVI